MKSIFFESNTDSVRHNWVAISLILLSFGALVSCATPQPVEKKVVEPVKKREITILLPEIEGIDGHPCSDPNWTKLPPKIGEAAMGDTVSSAPSIPTPAKKDRC